MRRVLGLIVCLTACSPVQTPVAPQPGYLLTVRVLDGDGMPILGAEVYGDWNVAARWRTVSNGPPTFRVNGSGHVVCAEVSGVRKCSEVLEARDQTVNFRF